MRTLSALVLLALVLPGVVLLSPSASASASLGCAVVPDMSYDGTRVAAASDGRHVYVFGGMNGDGTLTDAITELGFNGTPNRVVAHLSSPRAGVAVVWNGSQFLIFGGFTSFFPGGGGTTVDTIQAFEPVSGTMQTLAARLPSARGHATAVIYGGKAFVIGGDTGQANLDEIVSMDTNSKSVTVYARTGDERSLVAAALDSSNVVRIFGGHGNLGDDSARITTFVPGQFNTSSSGMLPHAIAGAGAYATGSGVVVLGGDDGATTYATAFLYAPGQGATDLGAQLPEARTAFGLASYGGLQYVIGGADAGRDVTSVVACGDPTSGSHPPDVSTLRVLRVSPYAVQVGTGWDFPGEVLVQNTGAAAQDATLQASADGAQVTITPATQTVPAYSVVAFRVVVAVPTGAPLGDSVVHFFVNGGPMSDMRLHVVDGGPTAQTNPDNNVVPYGDLTSIGANASEGSEGNWTIHFRNPSPTAQTFAVAVHAPGDWSVTAAEQQLSIPGPNGTADLHVRSRAGTHGGVGDVLVGTTQMAAYRVVLDMQTSSYNATNASAHVALQLQVAPTYVTLAANATVTVEATLTNPSDLNVDAEIQAAPIESGALLIQMDAPIVAVDAHSSTTVALKLTGLAAAPMNATVVVNATQANGDAVATSFYVTLVPARGLRMAFDRAELDLAPNESATVNVTVWNDDGTDANVTMAVQGPTWSPCGSNDPQKVGCNLDTAAVVQLTPSEAVLVVPEHGSSTLLLTASALATPLASGEIVVVASSDTANASAQLPVKVASAVIATKPRGGLGADIAALSAPQKAALAAGTVGAAAVIVASTRKKWPVVAAGLYARFAPSRLLEHPARQKLRALVEAEPGVTVNDAERASGLTHGAFAHHLQKLEDGGLVLAVRDGQLKRLFVPGAEPPAARAPLDERILDLVAQRQGGARPADLARELGASRQAVHYHLKRLVREGRLVVVNGGRVDLPTTSTAASA
jgi:DNA-binding transcriptional ArsR family regulator